MTSHPTEGGGDMASPADAGRAGHEPSPDGLGHSVAIPDAIGERLLAAVNGIESFARNWSWRSHSPTERARSAISAATESISNGVAYLQGLGATAEQVETWTGRAIRLWLAYQEAGGRTANPMITGPANFPVEKNRKAMETERKRGEEYYAFVDGAKPWMARQARSEDRAALSAEAATIQHRTIEFPGVKIVQNETLNRIQLLFDGKPEPGTIRLLKGEAFRWSPRETAWQRQNTNNGVQAAYRVLRALGHGKPAQGIAAGTDETATQARPEGQEPGSQSECAHD